MAFIMNHFTKTLHAMAKEENIEKLYSLLLQESMDMTRCDGGTLDKLENDGLHFKRVITKSLAVSMDSAAASSMAPLQLNPKYVCACAVLQRRHMNIPDVYNVRGEYDFSGTKQFDSMNNYRTGSMIVIPLMVVGQRVIGVMQLINAQDGKHSFCRFSAEDEEQLLVFASVAALCIRNLTK